VSNAPSILLDNYSPTAFEKLINFSTKQLGDTVNGQTFGNDKHSYHEEPLSPDEFAAARLKILDKSKRLVPFIYNETQRDLMNNLTGRDLVLKARQEGVSTAVQGMLYQEAVTGTATTMTLAHDDDGTQKLRRIAERFYKHDPQKGQRGAANARLTTYTANDSEAMIATAGNKTSGRSATLSHLHGSEVAFWPDAETLISAVLEAGNPNAILESTPNGAQGYFYDLCMEALDGNSVWHLHFYPWWMDSGYRLALDPGEVIAFTEEEMALVVKHGLTVEQIKWRRDKQRTLKHLFIQEYPEDPRTCFLRSGFGYFGDISAVFTAPLDPVYTPDHRYVAGMDFGQTNDYTTLLVKDETANVMVDLLRINQLPWAEMRRQAAIMCRKWHVALLNPEANSMGTTNIEELRRELAQTSPSTRLQEFWTSNESKSAVMATLHETLQSAHGLRLQNIPELRHELGAFVATRLPSGAWRLAAAGKDHDDTVIALALADSNAGLSTSMTVGDLPAAIADWRG
jgi:hypothetical protein